PATISTKKTATPDAPPKTIRLHRPVGRRVGGTNVLQENYPGTVAGRIKDEDIALVRERAPIADVVGEYLQLRNAGGGSLKGLCPFRDEKSPSFNVTPSKNLWYCFGCAEGGDVISFVQQIDSLSFTEAVESLARQSGIQLRYESSEGRSTRRDENKRQ